MALTLCLSSLDIHEEMEVGKEPRTLIGCGVDPLRDGAPRSASEPLKASGVLRCRE